MKKRRSVFWFIWIGALLIIFGVLARLANGEKTYSSDSGIRELEIIDDNTPITIVGVSDHDPLTITYFEKKGSTYSFDASKERLVVTKDKQKWGWAFLSFFNVGFNRTGIVVEVPVSQLSSLALKTSNAHLVVEDLQVDEATLKTSNAKVFLDQVSAAKSLLGETSNGKVELIDVSAASLECSTSNGPMELNGIAADDARFHTSNGKISFDDMSATQSLNLKTSNGSIVGELAGAQQDYHITTKTSNAKNNLSNSNSGTVNLTVRTTNGQINVDFAED